MVGIHELGNVSELANSKRVDGRGGKKADEASARTDASDGEVRVEFSEAAREASQATRALTEEDSEIRAEMVERAKRSIEDGTYKVVDMVRQVAMAMTGYAVDSD